MDRSRVREKSPRTWWQRLRRRVQRPVADGGFVLLESIIALTVITIVMGAVGAEFVGAMASTSHQRAMQAAVQIGDSEAERVRSIHPSDLKSGRGATSVATEFANAPVQVQAWLSGMTQISDDTVAATSGAGAALATSASSASPFTQQKPGKITYTVLNYLGQCWKPAAGTTCRATDPGGAVIYLRDVIAVTWTGAHCTPVCAYVTAVLVSATADQTFQVNQPLPPAPTLTNVAETVAVGDTLTQGDGSAVQLQVDDDTGVAPFTWVKKSGSFPNNLDISPTGLVSGGPIGGSAGTVTTQVQVTDAFLRTATMTITWTVEPPLKINAIADQASIVNTTLSPNVTLGASGGDGAPYTWSVSGGTSLPPGLSLSSAGVVSGKPTAVGTYRVTVKVVDKGGKRTTTTSFNWKVSWPPVGAPAVSTQTNTVGTAITAIPLNASGGDGQFVWSDSPATLPPGVSVSPAGVLTGTPTTTGAYAVKLTVSDPTAGTGTDYTKTVSFTWNVVAKPTVTAPADQTSSVGASINVAPTKTCPNSPCTYSLSANKPAGLTVDSTGTITGTIGGSAQTYTGITVTVTDRQGVSTTSGPFKWTVNSAPTMNSPGNQTTLRNTAVNLDMSGLVSGGTGSFTYSASNLPSGLSINATSGKITGTTGATNSSKSVTVTATDSSGVAAAKTFSWNVTNLAISIGNQATSKSHADSIDLDKYTTGGTGPYTYSASGLPSWLSLNTNNGVISGTAPASTGTTTGIKVTVTDSVGAAVTSGAFSWAVANLQINSISDQSTSRNNSDSFTPTASGGSGALTWSASGLPSWLSINSSTGKISGTAPGSRSTTSGIVVMVTDGTTPPVRSNAFQWKVT